MIFLLLEKYQQFTNEPSARKVTCMQVARISDTDFAAIEEFNFIHTIFLKLYFV